MSGRHALSFCTAAALSLTALAAAQAQPVRGYVDLHSHLAGHLTFGGSWFWGQVEGPEPFAVSLCDGGLFRSHAATQVPLLDEALNFDLKYGTLGDTGLHLAKLNGYELRKKCLKFLGIKVPGTCPREHYEDWPHWDTMAHQQMWHGWLRQAHQGGLRILVASMAESSFLCDQTRLMTRRYPCDEMLSVYRQAAYIRGMVGRNSSWLGIATTPAEARTLIAQGKLAIVLSVEVTKLFPIGDYMAQLDDLRKLGVVSVQVAHHANSRFAGTAPIPPLIKAAKFVEALQILAPGLLWWQPLDMTDIDETFCMGQGTLGSCDGLNRVNPLGLTQDGRGLVNAMMDRCMLVDVAHVSRKAFDEMYEISLQRGAYPLFSSHAHMWDTISEKDARNEKYVTLDEIERFKVTGGMVGLRTGPESTSYQGTVDNTCQGSSRSFAQSLTYAVDNGLTIGFGADLNGFIKQMRPRFRLDCPADFVQIRNSGRPPTTLQRRGLGHIGLLPELMDDLREIGTPATYLEHLNNSAEAFLQMWERSSQGCQTPQPGPNLARQATASASSSYCPDPTQGLHCYFPSRINDGDNSTALGGFTSWSNAQGVPTPHWVQLTWASPVTVSRVDLYTTSGFAIQDYRIEAWVAGAWQLVGERTGNTDTMRPHPAVPPVVTDRLRVVGLRGPSIQPQHVRVNEVEVY